MLTPEIIIHADDYSVEKESIQTYIDLNLSGKMDVYIKKYAVPGSSFRVELTVEKQKDGNTRGKLIITLGNTVFRSERDNFKKLDDLVNHLFTHVKEQMMK